SSYHLHYITPYLFFPIIPPPPRPTLFPYTTLFRSPDLESSCSESSSAYILRGRITSDKWFFRAWTAQEHACSIDKRLAYLVGWRSEEHTSELQSQSNLVCRLLLEKKKKKQTDTTTS